MTCRPRTDAVSRRSRCDPANSRTTRFETLAQSAYMTMRQRCSRATPTHRSDGELTTTADRGHPRSVDARSRLRLLSTLRQRVSHDIVAAARTQATVPPRGDHDILATALGV